ncbi:hypothetical protein WDW37_15455 [Bdellovibrionota bacterium FG-1]
MAQSAGEEFDRIVQVVESLRAFLDRYRPNESYYLLENEYL